MPGNNGVQKVNEASLHICNPQANRHCIHLIVYPEGTLRYVCNNYDTILLFSIEGGINAYNF
jgi:hypothetical protein